MAALPASSVRASLLYDTFFRLMFCFLNYVKLLLLLTIWCNIHSSINFHRFVKFINALLPNHLYRCYISSQIDLWNRAKFGSQESETTDHLVYHTKINETLNVLLKTKFLWEFLISFQSDIRKRSKYNWPKYTTAIHNKSCS